MSEQTAGRLALELVESDSGTIRHLCPVDKDGLSVLTVVEHEGVQFAAVYLDDDARRMVACWNACEGIPTPDLKVDNVRFTGMLRERSTLKNQRDELLKALKEAAMSLETISILTMSLETISILSGRKTFGQPPIETYMDDFMQVRGYANSRMTVAREAIAKAESGAA